VDGVVANDSEEHHVVATGRKGPFIDDDGGAPSVVWACGWHPRIEKRIMMATSRGTDGDGEAGLRSA
jgi:hypothetical protein